MINKIDLIDGCKGIVSHCDCKVLLIDMLGEVRAYLVHDVHLKSKDCMWTDINDAQDITNLVRSCETNFAHNMTPQTLQDRIQFIPKESFKFSHDNYIWFTRVSPVVKEIY